MALKRVDYDHAQHAVYAKGRQMPPGACDSHMHIFDPRFAPSAHWPRTPPVAPVAAYRQLQARLGTTRTVVVTPSTYGTDNACTLDALDQLGDAARGVAVVAQSTWAAIKGREALVVEWDESAAEQRSSAEITAAYKALLDGPDVAVARNDGDVAAALAAGHRRLEAEFEFPYLAHAALEPMNAVAWRHEDGIEVWGGHQMPDLYQAVAAQIAELARQVGADIDGMTGELSWYPGVKGAYSELVETVMQRSSVTMFDYIWTLGRLTSYLAMVQGIDQLAAALGVVQQVVLQIGIALDDPDVSQHFVEHAGRAAGLALGAKQAQHFPGALAQQTLDDLAV